MTSGVDTGTVKLNLTGKESVCSINVQTFEG